jgi:hypothetical protein
MNEKGKEFIDIIKGIVEEAQNISPEKRARFTAFQICMMLDDSGEFGDGNRKFKVVTAKGEPVEFWHHDL